MDWRIRTDSQLQFKLFGGDSAKIPHDNSDCFLVDCELLYHT